MRKRLVIALTVAFILSLGSAAFAAPQTFNDVPAKHWAYDAVAYLAKAGIIDGYDDKSFRGDKAMTRYEMSQVVAKAMANSAKATAAQKALIDKLAIEFALELNNLATRVTKLEQNQPNIKFSGTLLEQYKIKTYNHVPSPGGVGFSAGQFQIRLNATAKIDDDTSFGMRLANPTPTNAKFRDSTTNYFGDNADNSFKVDRFFATTKMGGVNLTVGRQAMVADPEDVIVDSAFFSYDGLKLNFAAGDVQFDYRRGKFAKGVTGYTFGNGVTNNSGDFANIVNDSLSIYSKSGNFNWGLGVAAFTNRNATYNKTLMEYNFANFGYLANDLLSFQGEYGKNKATGGGSFYMFRGVYGAQSLNAAGKQNFTVQYLHAGNNSINGVYTSFDQPTEDGNTGVNGHGWNNWDFAYRYAFSKMMVGKLQYGSVKDKVDDAYSYHLWKLQVIYKF